MNSMIYKIFRRACFSRPVSLYSPLSLRVSPFTSPSLSPIVIYSGQVLEYGVIKGQQALFTCCLGVYDCQQSSRKRNSSTRPPPSVRLWLQLHLYQLNRFLLNFICSYRWLIISLRCFRLFYKEQGIFQFFKIWCYFP